jgi:hypothetical protein
MEMPHNMKRERTTLINSLILEEAGMTMGLAIIMIVLIGVMGAGLLTFVRSDLEAVVEVNQGQRGLEWAEAGVEAAKMQLSMNANGELYNGSGGDLDGDGSNTADSEWSYQNSDGSAGSGKTINLDGAENRVNVKIQYLKPAAEDETKLPDFAPEALPPGETRYPGNRDYFKITAQGTARDANRRVEAIYYTREIGFPAAYFASGNIDFGGNAFSIGNVSVFSRGEMIDVRGDNIIGCDTIYGNWNRPPWNNKGRNASTTTCKRTDGTEFIGYPTGLGAEGKITYKSGDTRLGSTDYAGDGSTNPKFVPNTWESTGGTQGPNDISYPFNPDPDTQVDLETLRAIAASGQNGSKLVKKGANGSHDIDDFPTNSNANTVYYVEFSKADGTFANSDGTGIAKGEVTYSSNPDLNSTNGTIVIVNGDLRMSPSSKTDFRGAIIIRDPVDGDSIVPEYYNKGKFDLQGFVNVEGTITIQGNADSVTPDYVKNVRRAGTYTVERWSWRECYSTACN